MPEEILNHNKYLVQRKMNDEWMLVLENNL
ncbi:hypothetical protein JOE44_000306 [Chryseobacterium sp. PvR013]|nr:hypothetical protein [Chryseobacterium sp. PvR013]